MSELLYLLKQHYNDHPAMEVQDAVKFLHQRFCGPGHLIVHHKDVLARLEQELALTPAQPDGPLYEPLGNGLCRLNLAACKAQGLAPQTMAHLLVLTANSFPPDPQGLEDALDVIYELDFDPCQVRACLDHYRAQGCPMVSHSEAYRTAYSPAYRVVYKYYADILPVLCAIDRSRTAHPMLHLAIDGPCASGKSTLAAALADIYHCPLIHMDDFFLRPEQRTPERLTQPGGNVDHERFTEEIHSPMSRGETITYRPWRCGVGDFGPEVVVPPAPLTIIEGCYSLRRDLRDAYQLRVWVQADWPSRRRRLLERGGQECLARFESQWIPLENRYFKAHDVAQCCHLCLDLSN